MQRLRVDTVRVVWDHLPGPYQGALVVGCGARNESVDQIGLSTLVVKLALDAVGRDEDDSAVDPMAAYVSTSGSPDEVAAFVADCCTALADLRLDDLEWVAGTVGPVARLADLFEWGGGCRDPWASLLARRYGGSGPGLMRWPAVDGTRFTVPEVRAHAARYFTADNTVLALSGAPAADLRLPLPGGSPVPRVSPQPASRAGACWYPDEVDGVGIAVSGTAGAAAVAVQLVLAQRVRVELERGELAYRTTPWWTPLDRDRVEFGLALRLADKSSAPAHSAAATVLWRELQRLAAAQPDRYEIEGAAQTAAPPDPTDPEYLLDQQSDRLLQAAQQELFGVSDMVTDADRAHAAAASPDDVRAAAASWLETAMVVVPAGTGVELAGMARSGCPVSTVVPDGVVLEPSSGSFWRRRRTAATVERLVVGDDACWLVGADGAVHTFPMADIMVVDDGPRVLLGNVAHGCLVDITTFGGRALFAARLPARRHRTSPRFGA